MLSPKLDLLLALLAGLLLLWLTIATMAGLPRQTENSPAPEGDGLAA